MNDELRSSPKLISFVCAWEKFAAKPYLDQGNLLTWGYGHLQKPGEVPPKIITEQEAARIMARGDVESYDVSAVVTPAPMPMVLLGNSYLSRFNMQRTGDQMTLIKR